MKHEVSFCGTAISAEPDRFVLSVTADGITKHFDGIPYIRFKNGAEVSFDQAVCEYSVTYSLGNAAGIKTKYSGFPVPQGVEGDFSRLAAIVETEATVDGFFRYAVYFENEPEHGLAAVGLQHVRFGAPEGTGYSILPLRQGALIPAQSKQLVYDGALEGWIYFATGYMPMYGQVTEAADFGEGKGYTAIFETPYDARYIFNQQAGGDAVVTPLFISSLGKIGYKRSMLYKIEKCDYNRMAKVYRAYLNERGLLVTLREKIAKNPAVAKLLGTPIIHTGIGARISPDSYYYKPDKPEANDWYVPFTDRAESLKKLKAGGLEKAYVHLDGWGKDGYDNLHPSPFPPHQAAGGAAGMKALSDTCLDIGYIFGIHDQYRDYFYNGPDFDPDNAFQFEDGSLPFNTEWYGGKQSMLCSALAPDFVKRNYNEFQRLGIRIDGSYLDVFSISELDECFNPRHRVTREQCACNRRHCFEILNARGIITSSEEVCDCIVPSISLCHHAPYMADENEKSEPKLLGYPIPLFNLVWHDCIVIPWNSGCGGSIIVLPDGSRGVMDYTGMAMLNGGTVYTALEGDSAEAVENRKKILDLHAQIGHKELLRHEFVNGDPRRQRSVFAAEGGSLTVEVVFTEDKSEIRVFR